MRLNETTLKLQQNSFTCYPSCLTLTNLSNVVSQLGGIHACPDILCSFMSAINVNLCATSVNAWSCSTNGLPNSTYSISSWFGVNVSNGHVTDIDLGSCGNIAGSVAVIFNMQLSNYMFA